MEASKFRKPKLEGVTRTIFNLEDQSLTQGNGKKRVIHVSIEGNEGKKLYFSYAIKMINKTTFSMRCNQNRSTKKPCTAVLSCAVNFENDLIPYLIRCAADTPEPSDASEIDPSCDLSK